MTKSNMTDQTEQIMIQTAAEDPDRLLCVYFMPKSVRLWACAVLGWRCELLRTLAQRRSEQTAGSMAAYVRLQWWREVLEGTRLPEHPLAPLLLKAIEQGRLSAATLCQQISSIEAEIENVHDNGNHNDKNEASFNNADKTRWVTMLRYGAGAFQRSMGELLGLNPHREADYALLQRLEAVGMAYAAGAMIRHFPHLKQQGRYLYPGTLENLRQEAQQWLAIADMAHLPRYVRVAALPAIFAKKDLVRGTQHAGKARGLGDKWAVICAGIQCQIQNPKNKIPKTKSM
ncbi:MAG: phytoene synthase [Acetobacter sp.]|nr:phytoene synthase [Acetobacter sp.]